MRWIFSKNKTISKQKIIEDAQHTFIHQPSIANIEMAYGEPQRIMQCAARSFPKCIHCIAQMEILWFFFSLFLVFVFEIEAMKSNEN